LDKDFDHPYPAVQDTDDYDKDYVKDENDDGGEWTAQQEYDALRSKLEKLQADEKKALDRKRELERQLDDEMARRKALGDQTKKLDDEKRRADQMAKEDLIKAEDNLRRIEQGGPDQGGIPRVGVRNQSKVVTGDVSKLEECKKQLMEVHAKLKRLQEERLKAQKDLKDADSREKDALSTEFSKQKKESQLETEVSKEEAAHLSALKTYRKEAEEFEVYEKDLAKAEARLRKFRRKEVDQAKEDGKDTVTLEQMVKDLERQLKEDGGVYEKKPSKCGSLLTRPSLLLTTLGALAALSPTG